MSCLTGVYISTNQGQTWQSRNNGLASVPTYSLINSGNKLIVSTSFNGIYYSLNNGSNWSHMNSGMDGITSSFLIKDSVLYAGTLGQGVYKFPEEVIGISNSNNNVPSAFKLYQNYPNPFNPNTKIKYEISQKTDLSIKIYDVSGKEVFLYSTLNVNPGIYEFDWDGKNENGLNLPSGIYFYRFETEKFSETKKMVLIK